MVCGVLIPITIWRLPESHIHEFLTTTRWKLLKPSMTKSMNARILRIWSNFPLLCVAVVEQQYHDRTIPRARSNENQFAEDCLEGCLTNYYYSTIRVASSSREVWCISATIEMGSVVGRSIVDIDANHRSIVWEASGYEAVKNWNLGNFRSEWSHPCHGTQAGSHRLISYVVLHSTPWVFAKTTVLFFFCNNCLQPETSAFSTTSSTTTRCIPESNKCCSSVELRLV